MFFSITNKKDRERKASQAAGNLNKTRKALVVLSLLHILHQSHFELYNLKIKWWEFTYENVKARLVPIIDDIAIDAKATVAAITTIESTTILTSLMQPLLISQPQSRLFFKDLNSYLSYISIDFQNLSFSI